MPNHYTADGPRVQSSSVPDRGPDSFNDWQEDLQWERDLERLLEDFKRSIGQRIRTAYYASKDESHTRV